MTKTTLKSAAEAAAERLDSEVLVVEPRALTTPADVLSMAMTRPNTDLDQLERLMALQREWEANEARKAFSVAFALFKANAPEIEKDAHVHFKGKDGKADTDYRHASLGNVTNVIATALGECGLSHSFDLTQGEQGITCTCKLRHELGHEETLTMTAPADQSGGKNTIQAIASTFSYLQRDKIGNFGGTL